MFLVCKYVCEKGVNIKVVFGFGKNGCIIKEDVDVYLNGGVLIVLNELVVLVINEEVVEIFVVFVVVLLEGDFLEIIEKIFVMWRVIVKVMVNFKYIVFYVILMDEIDV